MFPHAMISEAPRSVSRRGGRAVDGTGLENRHTGKGIGGSNPSLSAILHWSSPETWVTQCTGHMGDTFGPNGLVERFEHPSLQIEVPQIIIHKADQPYVVVNLIDADGLSSKDLAEIQIS